MPLNFRGFDWLARVQLGFHGLGLLGGVLGRQHPGIDGHALDPAAPGSLAGGQRPQGHLPGAPIGRIAFDRAVAGRFPVHIGLPGAVADAQRQVERGVRIPCEESDLLASFELQDPALPELRDGGDRFLVRAEGPGRGGRGTTPHPLSPGVHFIS